jgi:hypothetical protein
MRSAGEREGVGARRGRDTRRVEAVAGGVVWRARARVCACVAPRLPIM